MYAGETFKKRGIAHLAASAKYSWSGARYLAMEQAALHEVLMFGVSLCLFYYVGAHSIDYLVLIALFLLVMCIEAVNTAGEAIVDRVSPEISDFAKKAKDLLSFAVFCGLSLFCGFSAWVVFLKPI